MRCWLQDDIASLLVDGRIKAVVDSEFPFSQQGVTDMCALCPRPQRAPGSLPHAFDSFAKIISGKSLGKNILNVA